MTKMYTTGCNSKVGLDGKKTKTDWLHVILTLFLLVVLYVLEIITF